MVAMRQHLSRTRIAELSHHPNPSSKEEGLTVTHHRKLEMAQPKPRGPSPQPAPRSAFQPLLQGADVRIHFGIVEPHRFDRFHGMDHRGVIAPAKHPANFRQ